MNNNVLYIMLLKEISCLNFLFWFEPIGSKVEKIMALLHDPNAEGLSSKEISFLRVSAKKCSKIANNVRQFLYEIGNNDKIIGSEITLKESNQSAIFSLIWNILIGSESTSDQCEIIEQIWLETMGYRCPYNFMEN